MDGWLITWLAVLVLSLVAEGITAALVSIWFSCGAAAAAILALCKVPVWLQITVFVLVSALLFVLFYRKIAQRRAEKTNVDTNIGKECIVTEAIDNLHETGRVRLGGLTWAAKSEDDSLIPEGTTVTVKAVSGVHLIVK